MNTVFWDSLQLMWKGMLSIFVVIAVIFVIVVIMSKFKGKKKDGTGGADV